MEVGRRCATDAVERHQWIRLATGSKWNVLRSVGVMGVGLTHKQIVVNLTRLPSNLRPTTRECLRVTQHVTHGHFRSRDNDGGHTIRATVFENPCCTQTSWL